MQRFADIVGDEDDGLAQLFLEPLELTSQLGAGDGIERAERLVHQQHGRLGGQGAGNPTRWRCPPESSCGIALRKLCAGQAYERQHFFYAAAIFAGSHCSSLGTSATFSKTV